MAYYDRIAKGYNELHGEEQERKVRIIKENLRIKKTDRLLDVGCGTGISTQFSCTCVGVDPSSELLRQAGNAEYVNAKAENLPFDDNSFDIVISVTAVHNFSNIRKGLKEMKRVGKNKFAVSVLKKSPKADEIISEIRHLFRIKKLIIEDKDYIYFLEAS